MKKGIFSLLIALAFLSLSTTISAAKPQVKGTVKGFVFWDKNANGIRDLGEPGVPNVCVSNGREVVRTVNGRPGSFLVGLYILPQYEDMTVFVVKPSGWMTAVNESNVPKFFYTHKPAGSPEHIQHFPGLEPTGPLPSMVNFPLYPVDEPDTFKVVINGDTQAYTNEEIEYVRDSFVKDVMTHHWDAALCISLGDNLGDDLNLYPRYMMTMGGMGMPVYYVPGNHDMDFDAKSDQDSLDTFRSLVGPAYYSFNYGKVHFVILHSVMMPADPSKVPHTGGNYAGGISEIQMEWLVNDLAKVPQDYLIVLNMHIPVVSDVDRLVEKHQVSNREQLYAMLAGRKVVSLGGHTHTISHFQPGDMLEGWGQPTPIPQIIAGAACGSWWMGDVDDSGVPTCYMRCGAPRNYQVFEFNGNHYTDSFKATLKGSETQMHLSVLTDSFADWYEANTNIAPDSQKRSRNDLVTRNVLKTADLQTATLVANVYNGSNLSIVMCMFDNDIFIADKVTDMMDPYALMNQLYVLRGVPGFRLWDDEGTGAQYGPGAPVTMDSWLRTTGLPGEGYSTHIWTCPVPSDLKPGLHRVVVSTLDEYMRYFEDTMMIEVVE